MTNERRYRVLGLVGEGGFGRVYKARFEAGGFSKDVAIKLLRDESPPKDVLQRLRDESRILALVRDRAMPAVEPPVLLAGRWAVVMEFVDGRSVAQLLKSHGALPATVALEITAEVARLLEKVYRARGPDDRPLHILHRDLKPDNLQITPFGEVKVLDFGIARGEFEGREAQTRTAISGTPGYIAPERMEGLEGPEGDVFSLGVTLEAMLTGASPGRGRPKVDPATLDPGRAGALRFARRLASFEPEERPTARAAEEECRVLGRDLEGPSLREWAERHVTEGGPLGSDEISGKLLSETRPGRSRRRWLAPAVVAGVAALLVVVGATVFLAVGTGVGVGFWVRGPAVSAGPVRAPPEPTTTPAVALETSGASPAPVAAPPAPVPDPPAPAAPVPELPTPLAPPAEQAPMPRAPATPESAAPAVTFPVAFGSDPLGAQVFVDGATVGTTPLGAVPLTAGTHRVRMVLGADSGERTLEVGPRRAVKLVWLGGDRWSQRF